LRREPSRPVPIPFFVVFGARQKNHGQIRSRPSFYSPFRSLTQRARGSFEKTPDDGEGGSSANFRRTCFLLDSSIFLAYVLLLALPLAIPLWSGRGPLRVLDPPSFAILDDDGIGNSDVAAAAEVSDLRADFINAYATASGYAYASSLNEVFMCLQRVEMSLAGVSYIRDVATKMSDQRRFFTSRKILYAELSYNFAFFWGMSLVACKACFDFDWAVYNNYSSSSSSSNNNNSSEHWTTIIPLFLAVYTSPAVLRGVLFRLFAIVMYPSMGMRCLATMKRLHREGMGTKMLLHEEEDKKTKKKKNDDDTVTTIIIYATNKVRGTSSSRR